MAIFDIDYGQEILDQNDPQSFGKRIQEMEMVLQNSSYGHEYAMLELGENLNFLEREELNDRLEEYRLAYFQARHFLDTHHPERLETIERDLLTQKLQVFKTYNA